MSEYEITEASDVLNSHATKTIGVRLRIKGPKGPVTIIANDQAEAQLFSEAPGLLEIVKGLEWSGHSHDAYFDQSCPECYRPKSDGHDDDCDIGKAMFSAGVARE